MSRMEQSHQREQEQEAIAHCNWHPEVETGLSCGRCGKHMCTQCMVQAPVGIRCRDCGKAVRMPTFDVRPTYYARAIGVGAAIALGGGVLWVLVNVFLGPLVSSLAAIGVGYGTGELISRSVNQKRSTGLAWIAAVSVIMAYLISVPSNPWGVNIYGLMSVAAGVFIAVQRVR